MKRRKNANPSLPQWYDDMLSNPLLLLCFVLLVLLASPLLLVYGALLPLFRK
ncbi:MAG: hypothetical protein ACQ5SW_00840 [Sphaerochaetaceae bacterium]